MNLFKTSAIVICLSLVLANCNTTSKFYTPTAATSTATLEELNSGKALLMDHCGDCHGVPTPRKHDAAGWNATLLKMQPKAKISDDQRELIYKYLTGEKI